MGNEENANLDITAMLEEAEKTFEAQVRSIDVLRDHGKTMLGVSSLLVSLFATFGGTNVPDDPFLRNLYTIGALLIALLYVGLIIENLDAILPEKIFRPIEPSVEEYIKAFLGKSKEEIIKQRISNYLNVIDKNRSIIDRKTKSSRLITGLFAGIFVLIILVSIVKVY